MSNPIIRGKCTDTLRQEVASWTPRAACADWEVRRFARIRIEQLTRAIRRRELAAARRAAVPAATLAHGAV